MFPAYLLLILCSKMPVSYALVDARCTPLYTGQSEGRTRYTLSKEPLSQGSRVSQSGIRAPNVLTRPSSAMMRRHKKNRVKSHERLHPIRMIQLAVD